MSKNTANRTPVAPEPHTAAPADTAATAAPAGDGTLPGVGPDAPAAFPPGADAADRIRAVLTAAGPDGVTAAHIADTAHVARSTVSKILTRHAKAGTARREVGGFIGRSRQPDRWHPVTAPGGATSRAAEATATGGAEPAANTTDAETAPRNGPATEADSAPDTSPDAPAAPDTPTPPDEADNGPDTAPIAPASAAPEPAPTPGQDTAVRLGPGALRGMVFDHMNTRPGQEFTPGQIGRALGGRSSGAVANACDKLTADGLAELVNDKPRRYRAVTATPPTADPAPATGTNTEQPAAH
ncbi:helix-turn-helix domain-containing protein [Yinghuangia sp. YIM S09857]|uniref:helix-turn-helix domain-containing protein n=1 Tax=Yinghuangia sp. YIM S09857 TaxID=3436929 RepID=UPI003F53C8E1